MNKWPRRTKHCSDSNSQYDLSEIESVLVREHILVSVNVHRKCANFGQIYWSHSFLIEWNGCVEEAQQTSECQSGVRASDVAFSREFQGNTSGQIQTRNAKFSSYLTEMEAKRQRGVSLRSKMRVNALNSYSRRKCTRKMSEE